KIFINDGDIAEEGQPLLILDAMKMEHTIKAPCSGTVELASLSLEMQITDGQTLLVINDGENNV
ncbi:MAG: acetyl-CoA carboxylase biotin carboxyl carrier protein subunit, partial [Emcibacteraceae bacterium]|nr:acetyl-CoA carboxylase biotin carboxyl carrier protein subunit [Emcibacteraceae bacterium]